MNKKFKLLLSVFVITLVTMLVFAGCGQDKTKDTTGSNNEVNQTKQTDSTEGTDKDKGTDNRTEEQVKELRIEHELGETVLTKKPEKVIVFDYGTLDALDQLGVDIMGLPKSNIPPHLQKYEEDQYEDVGTLFEPNFEKIFELKPDIIIVSARQSDVYEELAKIAPTLYVTIDNEDYMGSFKKNMNSLGRIFDKEAEVDEEVKILEEGIKKIHDQAVEEGKKASIIMVSEGALKAYGKNSRFGIIHDEFGFEPVDNNIEASNHGQSISFEYIADMDPEYIFVVDRNAVVGGNTSAQQVLENDIVKGTSAYKNNQIIYLDAHSWYVSSGGLQSTAQMIKDVQQALE